MHGMMLQKQRRLEQIAADQAEIARLDETVKSHIKPNLVSTCRPRPAGVHPSGQVGGGGGEERGLCQRQPGPGAGWAGSGGKSRAVAAPAGATQHLVPGTGAKTGAEMSIPPWPSRPHGVAALPLPTTKAPTHMSLTASPTIATCRRRRTGCAPASRPRPSCGTTCSGSSSSRPTSSSSWSGTLRRSSSGRARPPARFL